MPFGLVTKAYLKQREEELRREFERADFVAKEWYNKFRALYARLSRLTGAGEPPSPSTSDPPIVQPGATSSDSTTAIERRRRMRGF